MWYWLWPLGPDLRAAWANIYPNIFAWALVAIPAAIWAHIKVVRPLRRVHRRLDHQDRTLNAIHEQAGGDTP